MSRRGWSIRTRITVFVVVTIGLLIGLIGVIGFRTSLDRIESIETEQTRGDADRVVRQLQNSLDDVGGTNADWAWWDETHQFVEDRNADYQDSNLYAEAFTPIGIDLLVYYDLAGDVVFDAWYAEDGETAVPDDIVPLGQPGGFFADFEADPKATPNGLVRADGSIFLVTSRGVLPSDTEGPANGVLLMAREVTEIYVEELATLTNLDLSVTNCSDGSCTSASTDAQITRSGSVIAADTTVNAIDGRPALRLHVDAERTMYNESSSGVRRVMWILAAVGALALIVTIAGLRRLIVRPLERLGATVGTVARANDPSLRAEVGRTDEIGELAKGLNVMLERLEDSQRQLLTANEHIEGASAAKSRFLSHVSHELRTPLNAVLAYAQLLQLDDLDGDGGDSVRQIISAGRHITQLVDEFLDIARIEAGAIPLSIDTLIVSEIADEVISLTKPLVPSDSDGIAICGPTTATVRADPLRLRQVLLNLVSNAIKYGDDSEIQVRIRPGAHRTCIDVIDGGPGIADDQLHRLFVPFDRLEADGGSKEGTGLGLSVAKQLVELMDGTLEVVSTVGVGTTFTISMPGASYSPATADATPIDAVESDGDPLTDELIASSITR